MLQTKTRIAAAILMTVGLMDGGGLVLLACAADPVTSAAPSKDTPAIPASVWADLAGSDQVPVTRAILAVAKKPSDAVAFLKANLLPVKADSARVARLIKDLESNQFAVRQKATEELEYLDKYIKTDLEKAMESSAGAETKQRLKQLLDRLPKPAQAAKPLPPQARDESTMCRVIVANGQQQIIINGVPVNGMAAATPIAPPGPSAYWVRAVRAIAILEDIGTPEARQVIESLSKGEPGRCQPTRPKPPWCEWASAD